MSELEPPKQLVLPDKLISGADLSRLVREFSALDESLRQVMIRSPGQATSLARSSRLMEELATANGVSLLDTGQRAGLRNDLQAYANHPVRIHISFAAEPSPYFSSRIVIWLRRNIHPQIVLEIGLQPSLVVGCAVRTDTKVLDMSLRQRFRDHRHIIIDKLAAQSVAPPVTAKLSAISAPITK